MYEDSAFSKAQHKDAKCTLSIYKVATYQSLLESWRRAAEKFMGKRVTSRVFTIEDLSDSFCLDNSNFPIGG